MSQVSEPTFESGNATTEARDASVVCGAVSTRIVKPAALTTVGVVCPAAVAMSWTKFGTLLALPRPFVKLLP